jgi:hypothetical protein
VAEAGALLPPNVPISCVREAVDAIDWIIYARNTGTMRNKQLLANPRVVSSVPKFLEKNRRGITELYLRFAEVSGFLSGVATTACGNVAAKDMSPMSTKEEIDKTEVLRLVFVQVVFSLL